MERKVLVAAAVVSMLALVLSIVAVGTLGSSTGVLAHCGEPHGNAWGYWENGAGALGDCLDTGGVLFKGPPTVRPLGDPIDGGILF